VRTRTRQHKNRIPLLPLPAPLSNRLQKLILLRHHSVTLIPQSKVGAEHPSPTKTSQGLLDLPESWQTIRERVRREGVHSSGQLVPEEALRRWRAYTCRSPMPPLLWGLTQRRSRPPHRGGVHGHTRGHREAGATKILYTFRQCGCSGLRWHGRRRRQGRWCLGVGRDGGTWWRWPDPVAGRQRQQKGRCGRAAVAAAAAL
jgi:hypothetical protein